jgi:hypothetical protein
MFYGGGTFSKWYPFSPPWYPYFAQRAGKRLPRPATASWDDGKVLDDAQGYGYKSAEKARVADWYKTGGREKQRDKERIARRWLVSHPDVKQAYLYLN